MSSQGLRHMFVSVLFFSAMTVCAKFVGQRIPSGEVLLARVVITLFMTWWALRTAGVRYWGNRKGLLILRGFEGFIGLSCFFYSLLHLPLADATVIQFCNPMFTALLASLVLRERMLLIDWLALLSSLLGVVLIAQPSFLFVDGAALDSFALAIAVIGAFASASAYVTIRKLSQTEHPLVTVFYFPLVAGPASIPLLAVQGVVMPSALEWILLLAVGVFAQLGQVRMTKGLTLETAGRASAITYLQVPLAYAWGLTLFQETPNIYSVAGALLVVLGVVSVIQSRESGRTF